MTRRIIEREHSRGNQQEKMVDGLKKWLSAGKVTDALKSTRDGNAWKVMIA